MRSAVLFATAFFSVSISPRVSASGRGFGFLVFISVGGNKNSVSMLGDNGLSYIKDVFFFLVNKVLTFRNVG
jgi:hypothetical protein